MSDPRQQDLVEVPQNSGERLPLLRRGRRQTAANVPRLDLREHGKVSDTVEITRRPIECGGSVLTERHLRSFSICGQVRVFST